MDIDTIAKVATVAINGKSRYGLTFAAKTACRMNKGEAALFDGVVEKVAIVKNGFLGRNYERNCHAHGADETFTAQKPSGMHWCDGFEDVLLQADRDADKFYLRVSFDKQTSVEVHFLIGGRVATEAEATSIKAILAAKVKPSAKQKAAGVTEEVIVRSYGIDNILTIKAWGVEDETSAWEAVLAKIG